MTIDEEQTKLVRNLRNALQRYGKHLPGCKIAAPTFDYFGTVRTYYIPCSCGLHDAINGEFPDAANDLATEPRP